MATTQQKYPWRAFRRTFVQALIGAPAGLLAIAAVLTVVAQDSIASYLPPDWPGYLLAVSVFCATAAATLSRVMAIPAVDSWLKKVRLSSAPSE